ncbi:hypothetical protein VCHENC02_2467 [Vibrio harveyi]|uniref:Uncharacterized protein n=1 Tax=Vibrio harveyi TaxID=669 RepID=A0A454CZV5_VIBHA|nr:hypothetical protein VCHENC01_3884 [Vibrio harveyi]EKM31941.1 hypothetical protein VCHENC02_2467 [Vibrio harveyi]
MWLIERLSRGSKEGFFFSVSRLSRASNCSAFLSTKCTTSYKRLRGDCVVMK